jgi:hypothetical protein
MNARHGAAVAGLIAVLAAIVLVATWPDAGHPDDAHAELDAGTALAPAVEPSAPEEPSPAPVVAPPPPSSAPAALAFPPSIGTTAPPALLPTPTETSASPALDADEVYRSAMALVTAIAARRTQVAASLADAQRRGDAPRIARLTQQRDGLDRALAETESLVHEMEGDQARAPEPPSTTVEDLPVGP